MTPIDRFERQLPMALTDLAQPQTPDYLTDILGRTAGTRQRPAWASVERWLPVEIVTSRVPTTRLPWRQIGVVALLAVLLAALLAAYVGSQAQRLPPPFGPAANGLIVYSKAGDVFTRTAIDGVPRQLTATAETEIADSVSPLGTRVLLVLPGTGDTADLDVVGIDGHDRHHIGGPFQGIGAISWSPNESAIAVTSDVAGVRSITIVQTDGSGQRALPLGMPAESAQWRPPDGRQIAFRGQVDSNWDLFLADADGSNLVRMNVHRDLLEAPYEAMSPAWSPSGDRIAFHRLVLTPGNGNGNGFRIDIANVDASGALNGEQTYEFVPTSDDEHEVQWLPNGQSIAFMRHDDRSDYLAITRPVSGAAVQDLGVSTTTDSFAMLRYTIAPDGTSVFIHRLDDGADWTTDIAKGTAVPTDISGDDLVHIQRVAP